MSNTTIYATGNHKGKEEKGRFAFSIYKKNGKKPNDEVGEFYSDSKTSTHLNILIRSLKMAKETSISEEVVVYCDFPLVKKFIDGSIDDLEINDWKKGVRTIPYAKVWGELFNLTQELNVVYREVEKDDEKMKYVTKLMKNGGKIPTRLGKIVTNQQKNLPAKEKNEESYQGEESEHSEEEVMPISFDLIQKRVLGSTLTNVDLVGKVMEPDLSSIKVDPNLRKECQILFEEIGMDLDVAINVFLKHCIRNQGFTFDIRLKEDKE